MRNMLHSLTKDEFLEGFTKGVRLALLVTGYIILGAVLLSLVTPEQRLFYAAVDGSVLHLFPFVGGMILAVGVVYGTVNASGPRPKASYPRGSRTQLAK